MTITRESFSIEYDITSAESERVEFPFDFSARKASAIHCFDINPALPGSDPAREIEIPQSDFSVVPATGGLTYGGKVLLAAPVTVGHTLLIRRVTRKTQEKVFRNQRAINPEEIEDSFDKLTEMVQEVQSDNNSEFVADLDQLREADRVMQGQITDLQQNKANAADLQRYATTDALNAGLGTKANTDHTQAIGTVINLQATLDRKLEDAPQDGKTYGRRDGGWTEAAGGGALPEPNAPGDVLTANAQNEWGPEGIADLVERLPKASAGQYGVVKVDGTSIVETDGVLTAIGGGGEGTSDHRALTHRDAAGAHPSSAVTHGAGTVESVLATQQAQIGAKADAADLANYATETALADGLATKAPASHTHTIDDVSDLQTNLDGKPNDAPEDGKVYGRKDKRWVELPNSSGASVGDVKMGLQETPDPGWLLFDGAPVSRTVYADLFAKIGTKYGEGDGITTFNLPDMRGRSPLAAGQGPGFTNRILGSAGGAETHTLTVDELASHTHDFKHPNMGNSPAATGSYGISINAATQASNNGANDTGSDQAHNNMHPWFAINFFVYTGVVA